MRVFVDEYEQTVDGHDVPYVIERIRAVTPHEGPFIKLIEEKYSRTQNVSKKELRLLTDLYRLTLE